MFSDLSAAQVREFATQIVTQLEGPYKWYIMAGVGLLLTAFLTRFIFKTFKWFLVLVLLIAVMVGGFFIFAEWAGL